MRQFFYALLFLAQAPLWGQCNVSIASNPVGCIDALNAFPGGGTAPYSFVWSDASTAASIPANAYQIAYPCVTVTDAVGCTATACYDLQGLGCAPDAQNDTFFTSPNVPISGNLTLNDWVQGVQGLACYPYAPPSNGTLLLNPDGTFTYTPNLNFSGTDNFAYEACDAQFNCDLAYVTFQVGNCLQLSFAAQMPTCGQSDGILTIQIANGTPPYSANLLPIGQNAGGPSPLVFNALPAGNYTVVVSDASGCLGVLDSLVLQTPGIHTVALDAPLDLCPGAQGNFEAQVTGGAGPFTYFWDFGDGTAQVGNATIAHAFAQPGPYTVVVEVSDALGCAVSASALVVSLQPPLVTVSNNGPLCPGDTLALVADGIGLAGFAWQGPNAFISTEPFPFLYGVDLVDAGLYRVTISDFSGCTATGSTLVNVSSQIFVQINGDASVCANEPVSFTASANTCGQQPYSYAWSGPGGFTSTTPDIGWGAAAPADAGVYSVTVTDAGGASASADVTLAVGTAPILNAVGQIRPCDGSCDGRLVVEASGAAAPYIYLWSNGATGTQADGLCTGNYSVTSIDANGCTADLGLTLGSLPLPVPDLTLTDATCAGNDGTASINGADLATVFWSNGETSFALSGLSPGTFSVTVTGTNGCTVSEGATIGGPAVGGCGFTITGRVFLDIDNNCQENPADYALGGRLVTIVAGGPALNAPLGGVFTAADGSYTFHTEVPGPYGVKAWPGNLDTPPSPCDSIAVAALLPGDTATNTQLFLASNGQTDFGVTMSVGLAAAGQPYSATVCVTNTGSVANSTTVSYSTTSPNGIDSASIAYTPTAFGAEWATPVLVPGETYCATFFLTAPNVWQPNFSTFESAWLIIPDNNTENSAQAWYNYPVASLSLPFKQLSNDSYWFVPISNDSTFFCEFEPQYGYHLNYRITFQNTTQDTIQTVEIRDTLDHLRQNLHSLAFSTSSHPVHYWLEGANVLVARYENINLPPVVANSSESIGYFGFNLFLPDNFSQYFFNQPVLNRASVELMPALPTMTNWTHAEGTVCESIPKIPVASLKAYPNPTDGHFTLAGFAERGGPALLEVMDATGRIARTENRQIPAGGFEEPLSLDGLPNGVYIVRVKFSDAIFSVRVSKSGH